MNSQKQILEIGSSNNFWKVPCYFLTLYKKYKLSVVHMLIVLNFFIFTPLQLFFGTFLIIINIKLILRFH